jgi:hypothetical protein
MPTHTGAQQPLATRGPSTFWKIALGALLLLGLFNSVTNHVSSGVSSRELGYMFANLVFLILAVWLIVSGVRGPRIKQS